MMNSHELLTNEWAAAHDKIDELKAEEGKLRGLLGISNRSCDRRGIEVEQLRAENKELKYKIELLEDDVLHLESRRGE